MCFVCNINYKGPGEYFLIYQKCDQVCTTRSSSLLSMFREDILRIPEKALSMKFLKRNVSGRKNEVQKKFVIFSG